MPTSSRGVYGTRVAQGDSTKAGEHQSLRQTRVASLPGACVPTWLNAGVSATQVALWAGHGVEVLLRICAKCLAGQDAVARQRVAEALAVDCTVGKNWVRTPANDQL